MGLLKEFNRVELKYLIPINILNDIKHEISKYMKPDPYWGNLEKYFVSSLYYDTKDYRFYREKIDWIKLRRKLRIRRYWWEDYLDPEMKVFVEIKWKINRTSQKRRICMNRSTALDLCNNGLLPLEKENEPILDEIHYMLLEYKLNPTFVVSYSREAWNWVCSDFDLRVTIDTDILNKNIESDFTFCNKQNYILDPSMAIMEVKLTSNIPLWLSEVLARYNAKLVRISKYCKWLENTKDFLC